MMFSDEWEMMFPMGIKRKHGPEKVKQLVWGRQDHKQHSTLDTESQANCFVFQDENKMLEAVLIIGIFFWY